MNRTILGLVVTVAIGLLTTVAYVVTTSSLDSRIEKEVRDRVAKAQELLVQNASLEGLALLKRVEVIAGDEDFIKALTAEGGPDLDRADAGFDRFAKKGKAEGEPIPDIFAVTDAKGRLVAQMGVRNPIAEQWLDGDKIRFRSIELAIKSGHVTAEIWDYQGRGLMKVGISPIVDPDFGKTVGAMVVGYSLTAEVARQQNRLLGADVAYFYGDKVYATSFTSNNTEDTEKQADVAATIKESGMGAVALDKGYSKDIATLTLSREVYYATAGRMPRFSSKPLPKDYQPYMAGAVVLKSVTVAKEPLAGVRTAIGLLGVGGLIVAILAILLTAKSILGPLDQIEVGVNDIINGNIERTFTVTSPDVEGLSNALNVMLARFLGRPEPGEEEYDEDGNVKRPSALHFDTDGLTTAEAEAVALAAEPESDYLSRIFDEYIEARRQTKESVEGISLDSFVAKLRMNEANLKRKYECQHVRFKVLIKDDKVTLKPVPLA